MNMGVIRSMGPAVAFAGLFVVAAAAAGQITAILGRWENAWNAHDMAAFASLFHEDGVWVLWTGEVWPGRRAIEEGHAAVQRRSFATAFSANTSKS
jgi:uncharacterized protein (TIGR02246 family)